MNSAVYLTYLNEWGRTKNRNPRNQTKSTFAFTFMDSPCSEADSDQNFNEILVQLTECCQSSLSVTNILQEVATNLGSGTAIKHFADVTVSSYVPSEFRQHFRMGCECFEVSLSQGCILKFATTLLNAYFSG